MTNTIPRLDVSILDNTRLLINYDELLKEYEREDNSQIYDTFIELYLAKYEFEMTNRRLIK